MRPTLCFKEKHPETGFCEISVLQPWIQPEVNSVPGSQRLRGPSQPARPGLGRALRSPEHRVVWFPLFPRWLSISPRGTGRGSISASGPGECSCFQPWRGSTTLERGRLPGREFTAAAYRAKSEPSLLLVFEGSRALMLKLEWIRIPWSCVKLQITGAAPRFSDLVGQGWGQALACVM